MAWADSYRRSKLTWSPPAADVYTDEGVEVALPAPVGFIVEGVVLGDVTGVCFRDLPHFDRREPHRCDCVCVLPSGHPGRHRCSYVEAQRLRRAR